MKKEHNNQIIAEFLELRPCQRCPDCGGFYVSSFGEPTDSGSWICHPDEMNYHKSWNWLMPLVEKIESIWHDDHGYFGVFISSNGCTIQGTKFRSDIIEQNVPPVYFNNVVLGSKLESTYYAITNFIKWYLKNIKTDDKIKTNSRVL